MAVTQSRYARMHKDSHTKPLHDATAQMAVHAQMHRPPMTANARMRDSACPKFRTDAKPTEQARFDNPTPPHFHPLNEWGYHFWCGGWTNTHRAGKARTQSHQSVHKRARMRDGGHTKPLCKDATAQMAVDTQMQRHKQLTLQRCKTGRASNAKRPFLTTIEVFRKSVVFFKDFLLFLFLNR